MQCLMEKDTPLSMYKNIDKLSKDQVLDLLTFLTERINHSFIMMGGLLQVIRKNKWYKPDYANFQLFCDSLVEIQYRKAMYLISIYDSLVINHVPFAEVTILGYTKLVMLAPHFTEENYKTVIMWAKDMKVSQLETELLSMEQQAKDFFSKVSEAVTLDPTYKEITKTLVNSTLSDLKKLILTNPIQDIVTALEELYPEKVFTMVTGEKLIV